MDKVPNVLTAETMEPTGAKLFSWKRLSYFLSVLVVAQCFLLYNSIARSDSSAEKWDTSAPVQTTQAESNTALSPATLPHFEWKDEKSPAEQHFDDGYRDALSVEQCDIAFPDLYYEIDRATKYFRDLKHKITPEDTWDNPMGSIRFLIHRNELRIINSTKAYMQMGGAERAHALTNMLHRAVESATAGGEMLPTVEFTVSLPDFLDLPTDSDTTTTWAWTRVKKENADENRRKFGERLFLMPNFDMYSLGDRKVGAYHDARFRASQYDSPLEDKIPQAVWRGSRWVNPEIRDALLNITRNATWAAVEQIDWMSLTHEHQLTVDQFCAYRYAIHTEGISYSGRLSFLLNCDSLPIVHDLVWTTHYYHLLVPSGPKQNYIPAKRDWSDLEEKVQYYIDHPDEADLIRKNSINTFRGKYLTRAATSCYFRKLIREYAKISFTPEVHDKWPVREGDGSGAEEKAVAQKLKEEQDAKAKANADAMKAALAAAAGNSTANGTVTVTVTVTAGSEETPAPAPAVTMVGAPAGPNTDHEESLPVMNIDPKIINDGVNHRMRRVPRSEFVRREEHKRDGITSAAKPKRKEILVRRGLSYEELMYGPRDFEHVSEFYVEDVIFTDWQERKKLKEEEKKKGGKAED
ncbi:unnamed protein product [Cercospora beticola]|nr:unnamed protein product [Cercospora beticola]